MQKGTYTFSVQRGDEKMRRSVLNLEMDHKGEDSLTVRVGGEAVKVAGRNHGYSRSLTLPPDCGLYILPALTDGKKAALRPAFLPPVVYYIRLNTKQRIRFDTA